MGRTNTWIIYRSALWSSQTRTISKVVLSGNAWMLSGGLPATAYSEKLELCQFSKPA